MPPLPPSKYIVDTLQQDVLPGAAGAALIVCLFLTLGRWTAALACALGVAVAFVWANYAFQPNDETYRETGQVLWEKMWRLIPWHVEADTRSAWHWLPKASLILLLVGLLSRWMGLAFLNQRPDQPRWRISLLVWAPRTSAVVVVCGWLVSDRVARESAWLQFALPLIMLLIWLTCDGLARAREGGEIALALAFCLLALSGVLIYSHTAQLMELAVIAAAALFGIAAAVNVARVDCSGAIPAAVVFLPGLAVAGQTTTISNVPSASFWLAAVAPLFLAPFLLPALARRTPWWMRILRLAIVLLPLITAIVLAAWDEKLAYEE
jgi:hypothetical protein